MNFKYYGQTFTGSRSEIIKQLKVYLNSLDVYVKGTLALGEEGFARAGYVERLKGELVDKILVRVPLEFGGGHYTEAELRYCLEAKRGGELVEHVDREQLIDWIIKGVKNA